MSDILDPQTTAEVAPELAEAEQEATGTVPQVDAADPHDPVIRGADPALVQHPVCLLEGQGPLKCCV